MPHPIWPSSRLVRAPQSQPRPSALARTPNRRERATLSATDDQLSTPEVRRRAVTGAVVDALRGMGVRLVGLVGTLVTARLLTPYDFGLVAFGTTLWVFGD